MSILDVQEIISFPSEASIDEILNTDSIDIISPFYSGWTLKKLVRKRPSQVRFITRLPDQYHSAPIYLDNDPRPLGHAMDRLGPALRVFALPNVHAKLYLTDEQAWLGSANFTRNGFSKKGELLVRVSPPGDDLSETFRNFLNASTRVSRSNVDFLVSCVGSNITRVNAVQSSEFDSGDISVSEAISYEDFGSWLQSQSNTGYILDRMSNKNRMSGHVYSGFHGISSFVSKNPNLGQQLLDGARSDDPGILDRLADFVRRYGRKFGGPRGGTWNSKLSIRLGGTQSGGGAGDAVVKQLLVEVPRYLRDRGVL